MKKLGVFLIGLFVLSLSCPPVWAKDVIRIRFGHVAPPMHTQHKASDWFANYLERESGGRITCSTHPKGQLGSHIQMMEGLQVGTLEMGSFATPAVTEFVPEVALLSMPFMFESWDEIVALVNSPVGEKVLAAYEPKGLYCGGYATHGFRSFLNRKMAITKLEDMKKCKWRIMPNELFIDIFKAMGVSPITLPWPEVFSALQRGVIDGIDLTPNETWGAKVYEVISYISLINYAMNLQSYTASLKFVNSLPPDLRSIFIKSMKEAAKWHAEQILEEDKTVVIPDLKKKGVKINNISGAELARFKEAVAPVNKKWREKIGPDLYDEALDFLKKLRGQ